MSNRFAVRSEETTIRSITKAITYRLATLISDATVISFVTNKTDEALGIILFTNIASTVMYFIHEKLWNRILWGVHMHIDKYDGRMHERTYRTLTKALTYRALGMTSDLIVVTYITNHTGKALGIILFTNIASTTLYFFHERVWNRFHWGKNIEPRNKSAVGEAVA